MAGTSMSTFAREYSKILQTSTGNKLSEKKGVSKYHAKKTKIGDITFDSKIEACFYNRLLWMMKANKIHKIVLQPVFVLQEEFFDAQNNKHSAIKYRADFKVLFVNGCEKVYDTKGYKTEIYRIKKKLFIKRYPHIIFEEVFDPDSHPLEVA